MAGAPAPSGVPQSTVLVMSPVAERRFSIGRFLEWELPHLRFLFAASFQDCRALMRGESVDLLVLDAAHGTGPRVEPEVDFPARVPRIYVAAYPQGSAESSPGDAQPAAAYPVDFRRLLDQVKRAFPPRTRP